MEINELQKHPITRRVRPVAGGFEVCDEGGFELTWDANKFTSEVGRRMARIAREQAEKADKLQAGKPAPAADGQKSFRMIAEESAASMEITAEVEDLNRLMYADALASDGHGILICWGITKDGRATSPTNDYLLTFQEPTLVGLFQFCQRESRPKGRAAETQPSTESSPMTAPPTSDGSSTAPTPAATAPNT